MPKKATDTDSVDPVRSRLAASRAPDPVRSSLAAEVAGPAPSRPVPKNGMRAEHMDAEESGGGVGLVEAPARTPRSPVSSKHQSQRLTINRKFLVTPQEHDRMDEVLALIGQKFGKAAYSHVSRALWTILAKSEEAIEAAPARERMQAPAKGDYIGMAEFEDALADFLLKAIKRS